MGYVGNILGQFEFTKNTACHVLSLYSSLSVVEVCKVCSFIHGF